MSEETDKADKTEEATPRRLEKSREDGDIARSKELATFFVLMLGIGALWSLGGFIREGMVSVMESTMSFERELGFDSSIMLVHLASQGLSALLTLIPFFLIMLIVGLIAPALLGGWVMSAKSLEPKLSKLNPISGIKKMLSMQTVIEFIKAIAKSLLVGLIAVIFLKSHILEVMGIMHLPLDKGMPMMFRIIALGCALMAFSLIVVAAIDIPFQLHSHSKKLKMSKDEIKREHKESEGDPHLKAKIRQQQQAISRSRMMSKVPQADVIITNPTHFAVALSYKDNDEGAPIVVAKGIDGVASRIREIGQEHGVLLIEAPPLARALYWHVDLEQEIPADLFTAVAEVLAWVYQIRRYKKEGGDKPYKPSDIDVPTGMDVRPTNSRKKEKLSNEIRSIAD